MIINHTHRFVFVHIPKAAGTTVTRMLSQLTTYRDQEIGGTALGEAAQTYFFSRFGLRKHSRADEILSVMGAETYGAYFRFAFVRNPYSRLASAFHFLKAWSGVPLPFKEELDRYPDFASFLDSDLWTSKRSGRGPDAIFQPQARWLHSGGENPRLLVDLVGKAETLNQDLAAIFTRVGVAMPVDEGGRSNESPRYRMPEVWKPEWIARITEEYRRDFEAFGYSSDPPDGG